MSIPNLDADDEEIVEIFVEEADEVLQEIDRHLKTLKSRPSDRAALGEVRRGFHTLKGSGRMAKALELGELAWKIENMLNRAIEGKISVNEPLLSLIAKCQRAMPTLVDAFKNRRKSGLEAEMELMMEQADALASGQAATAAAPRRAAASGAGQELGDMQHKLDQMSRRADEALHRAEMALQHSRRLGGEVESIAADLQNRRASPEIKQLAERINILARDIMELRELSKAAPGKSAPDTRELQQLIDQRVRDRTSNSERSVQTMEAEVEEALQTALAARRVGMWALTIGILLSVAAAGAAYYTFMM